MNKRKREPLLENSDVLKLSFNRISNLEKELIKKNNEISDLKLESNNMYKKIMNLESRLEKKHEIAKNFAKEIRLLKKKVPESKKKPRSAQARLAVPSKSKSKKPHSSYRRGRFVVKNIKESGSKSPPKRGSMYRGIGDSGNINYFKRLLC
tara:strand:+ start:3549 stop:4001 length:453 start_codon:yes stop_codon:yes gene_type:complete